MASPSCCGGLALLLSGVKRHVSSEMLPVNTCAGLKKVGGRITPNRIRRAIENTAVLPSHGDYRAPPELIFGRGLLQVGTFAMTDSFMHFATGRCCVDVFGEVRGGGREGYALSRLCCENRRLSASSRKRNFLWTTY